jgi:nucleoside-diphosphate-sugar epimerase
MRVLVLGATGYVGQRLMNMLANTPWAEPAGASRGHAAPSPGLETLQVDTRDPVSLATALRGFDAVVNCVAGSARAISDGSLSLAQACQTAECARIVHLSTMSVYGPAEGLIDEKTPLDPALGWYGRAKCEAETHLSDFSRAGGQVVILRPGCVFGPGSELWVGRTGRWLHSRRLGDLGAAGDGWSNLVHVDDVCQAVMAALQLPLNPQQTAVFNLAAPDSPRWNDYFVDLALATGATPVPRLSRRQIMLDTWVAAPPLKLAQLLLKRLGMSAALPDPMPPGLPRLWKQHLRLDSSAAAQKLGLDWTPYAESLQSSASWFLKTHQQARKVIEKPLWMH